MQDFGPAADDPVVLALGGEAREELDAALRDDEPTRKGHRAGDCAAPRYPCDAMLEGTRVGRAA